MIIIIVYRELVSWVNDMKRVIEATELAKDLSGAESLLQGHKERKVPFYFIKEASIITA